MDDLMGLFGAISAGPSPKVARTTVDGITVSTVDSTDMGYETALCDENGAHPVERYDLLEKAEKGHKRWVKFTKGYKNEPVTKLGYGSLADDETITLKKRK